jgi:SAM-dependent methyltransferase
MKFYDSEFFEDSSWDMALRLLAAADVAPGVVLDLGSGHSPLAGRLADLGFTPVACDINAGAIADLLADGVEAHVLSLMTDESELVAELTRILDGRQLSAVLALDVLEHLIDPGAVLRALRTVALEVNPQLSVIVSIPNITHVDIAAKLLMGRWDVTDTGLLDDTHLRFFSIGRLDRLIRRSGWADVAGSDVRRDITEQCFPSDSANMRPGTPLNDAIRHTRSLADPHGTTFQFVRRLEVADVVDVPNAMDFSESRDSLSALIVLSEGQSEGDAESLLGDIKLQGDAVADVVVTTADGLEDALRQCATRWVAVLHPPTRLTRDWATLVVRAGIAAPGQVLGFEFVVLDDDLLADLGPETPDVGVMKSIHGSVGADPFDLLHFALPLFVTADCYVVPAELARSNGVVPVGVPGSVEALGVWIARARNLSGISIVQSPVVVIARSALTDADVVLEHVLALIDDEPIFMPAGSASRLAEQRRRFLTVERKSELYANQLHRLDRQVAAEREELAKLRAVHSRRPSRRVIAMLRRARSLVRRLVRAG